VPSSTPTTFLAVSRLAVESVFYFAKPFFSAGSLAVLMAVSIDVMVVVRVVTLSLAYVTFLVDSVI